jgi:hypothetical protein
MGLDQEIDCTTQAPYAVANRELIEVLIIRDGDSNMNFFCFWPTLNARSGGFQIVRLFRQRRQTSCLNVHCELDMRRAAPSLLVQRAGGSASPREALRLLLVQRFSKQTEVTGLRFRRSFSTSN